ncbi:MAG: hypothetical protein WB798_06655, partial [Nocardioidaceae bacterium]
ALRVGSDGPLRWWVLAARTGPDGVRLRVEVAGIGSVHAVGDRAVAVPAVGHRVGLVVDLTRTARLIDPADGARTS